MGSLWHAPLPQDGGDEGRCPVVQQTSRTAGCCGLGTARHVHRFHSKIPSKPWLSNAALICLDAAALQSQHYLVGSTASSPSPSGAAVVKPSASGEAGGERSSAGPGRQQAAPLPAAPSASHAASTGSGAQGQSWRAARPRGGVTCAVAGLAGGGCGEGGCLYSAQCWG